MDVLPYRLASGSSITLHKEAERVSRAFHLPSGKSMERYSINRSVS